MFHKAFESDGKAIKDFVAPAYPKSQANLEKLTDLFTSSFLTKNLDAKSHTVLAKAMFNRTFVAGKTIINYGEIGTEYFVLARGQVRVSVFKPGTTVE